MKKRFLFCLLTGLIPILSYAQDTIPNPSPCAMGLVLNDATCPDDRPFFDPNRLVISVNNAPGTTLGQDVYLKQVKLLIRHGWASDLDITLQSPGGQRIVLTSDNGGGDANYGDPTLPGCSGAMVFDASACQAIDEEPAAAPFTAGPYQPEESLLVFNDSLTNPNGDWLLEICDDFEADSGYLDFVELVFEPLSCLPVSEVQVLNIDTTTVVLDWAEDLGCESTSTYVEYGPPGFTPGIGAQAGQGTVVLAGCPPFSLMGLDPETGYDIYLRKSCGSSFSGNSCGNTVITGCQPPAGRLLTTFDQEDNCTGSCGTAECLLTGPWFNEPASNVDWQVRGTPTPTQGTGPESDVNGTGQYLYLETSGNNCLEGSTAELRSGCFLAEADPQATCNIAFNYHMLGPDIGSLRLQVSKTGGQSWQTIWQRQNNQGAGWKKTYLEFSSYQAGDRLQFRFLATRGRGSQGDIAIDQIAIYGLTYEGRPNNAFYLDADNDGYGDTDRVLYSCLDTPPDGYVSLAGDCNDTDDSINPGRPEVPCDNIDNNCNGLDDDTILPPPIVFNDTICDGDNPFLRAQPVSGKSIFWYTTPDDLTEIPEFGVFYSPDLPPNNTAFPQAYTFYAEETDFRCFSEPRVPATVVVNPTPAVTFTDQPILCPGEVIDLASLDIEDQRGTGASLAFFSEPSLNPGSELGNTNVQPSGDTTLYFAMTTDQGCRTTGEIPISVNPGPALEIDPGSDFSLCVESTQELSVTSSSGMAPFNYQWSTGEETPSITVEADRQAGQADQYVVTVTDQLGCTADTTITVSSISSISSILRTIDNPTGCDGQDGAITITPQGGLLPFTYEWQGTNGISGRAENVPSNSYTIDSLLQGAYRITVTDNSSDGCVFRLRTTYVNGPDAEVTSVDVNDVSCAGASDGQICLQVIGAPTYLWSTGATTPCLDNLEGGLYSVTITEGGCETIVDSIRVSEPLPLSYDSDLQEPECSNAPDGQIRLSIFGGSPGYTVRWEDESSGSSRTNLITGLYPLTITDANGCTLTDSILLNGPARLVVVTDSVRNISCNGEADGYLAVDAQGGTGPYQYQWSTGASRRIIGGLEQQFYTVTVTDFNGCTATRSYPISEPDPLRLRVEEERPPICIGDTSGLIRVRATGGRSPYTYTWADGSSGQERTQLPVGTYRVIATDASGCLTDTLKIVLAAASAIDVTASINDALCTGRSDGRITLSPVGSAPFRYEWERGDQSGTLQNAAVGTYPVRITDTNGCLLDTSFTVDALSEPIQPVFSLVQPQCAGAMDGRISVTISGTPRQPLQYEWNDGPFVKDRLRVGTGNYQVTITDDLGCQTISDTLRIQSPDPIEIELAGRGDILCQGDDNGFLELDVSGGIGPYTYTWTGSPDTTSAIYGLDAGQYRVFVTDANGCPAQESFNLADPPRLVADVDVFQGNICIGDSSNRLSLDVKGGMRPYQFNWNTGSMDNELRNVDPGAYSVTVSDANGCIEQIPAIKLRDPGEALQLVDFNSADISCFGARDGSLSVQIQGGTAPYRYLFSNAELIRSESDSVVLNGLPANSGYRVTVIDANGCVINSQPVPVREPTPLSVRRDSIQQNTCFGAEEGAIFVTAQGGTLPYSYSWYDSEGTFVSNQPNLRRAGAGTYQLVVSDQRQCSDTLQTARIVELSSPVRITDTTLVDVRCRYESSGAVRLQLIGGTPPYQYRWSNGATTQNLLNAPAGSYSLTITDSDTCRTIFPEFRVDQPDTRITVVDTLRNPSCPDAEDGRIRVSLEGGVSPYQLTWNREGTFLDQDTAQLNNLAEGLYELEVIDENQCRRTFGFQLFDPDSLHIDFSAELPDPDSTNGRLTANVQGGTPMYSYLWNTGDTLATIQDLGTGLYTLSVTDRNGCMINETFNLLTTSLEDPEWIEAVRLYPNPASEKLRLDLSLRQAYRIEWRLVDQWGQVLKTGKTGPDRVHQLSWNMSVYPTGTYRLLGFAKGRIIYSAQVVKVGR
jgi:hypothetical protein